VVTIGTWSEILASPKDALRRSNISVLFPRVFYQSFHRSDLKLWARKAFDPYQRLLYVP
jgi:hypothetical protein